MSERRFKELTPETMTDEQGRSPTRSSLARAAPVCVGRSTPCCAARSYATLCSGSAPMCDSGSIPPRLNELAICMAGRKWGAQYEFYAHRRLGIDAGLNPAILDAIAVGRRPSDMSADETMVYEFTTDLLSTGHVSDAKYQPVLDRFGERGVMDLVGGVGYYSVVSMVLNVGRAAARGRVPAAAAAVNKVADCKGSAFAGGPGGKAKPLGKTRPKNLAGPGPAVSRSGVEHGNCSDRAASSNG